MAFTKAEFAIKKIYARRFPGKTVNVKRKIIKLQGRAIEAAGSSYVATQSAYVKKTTEESVEEGNLLSNPQNFSPNSSRHFLICGRVKRCSCT